MQINFRIFVRMKGLTNVCSDIIIQEKKQTDVRKQVFDLVFGLVFKYLFEYDISKKETWSLGGRNNEWNKSYNKSR